nr:MAG TPA: Head Tail Connector Protein [Caudoviricetes sp.]
MAYTTFTFYENTYHGNVVPAEDFDRIADRASDFLDVITFDRLVGGLPDDERGKTKVQKAVCAVCDKLYYLELADIQALSAAAGGISSGSAGGTGGVNAGVITSRSAGSESISYASPSEMANGAKTWSAVYQAAGDPQETNKILESAARLYLTGVRDDKGVLLLYAGL